MDFYSVDIVMLMSRWKTLYFIEPLIDSTLFDGYSENHMAHSRRLGSNRPINWCIRQQANDINQIAVCAADE
jgi:hypothetical protein